VTLKLNIFIHVKTQEEIKTFAQIVHQYYVEETFNKDEVQDWLGELSCELHDITNNKIAFSYFDDWFPTRMTVYKSGRIKVETDLDEFP
jgi:hypothetical protein